MPFLRYSSPSQGVVFVELGGRPVTVGRSKDCQLVLEDESASRRHCEVRYSQGSFYLHDLGSKNGTYVNGRQVKMHALKDRDLISVANSQFTYQDRM